MLALAGCENFDAMHRTDREPGTDATRASTKKTESAERRTSRRSRTVYGAVSAHASPPDDDPGAKPGPYVLPKFVTVPVISIEDSRRILTDGGSARQRERQMAEDRAR